MPSPVLWSDDLFCSKQFITSVDVSKISDVVKAIGPKPKAIGSKPKAIGPKPKAWTFKAKGVSPRPGPSRLRP